MSRLKTSWIVMANIALMSAILIFVALYSNYERKENYRSQVEHFVNASIAMERVTGNYLEGEQQVCDNWAQYINSRDLTLEEAAAYIRATHVKADTSAHLIDTETMTGCSTRPRLNSADHYDVSYARMDLFGDGAWIAELGEAINITRTYTNPMNGEQSLAFCNRITVRDAENGEKKQAYLLRIVPVSNLEEKWVFPKEEFDDEDFSIIDTDGNYVIRGRSFKSNSFFEFYKSYNQPGITAQNQLFSDILSGTGSFTMQDSRDRECIVAHTPITSTKGWVLLSLAPVGNLNADTENWMLIGVISFGLLLLLATDFLYMQSVNKKLRVMAREAEAANKAKTDFLSTMSHDIRTPMNAIIGLTTIAEKNLGDQEAVADNLRKISLAGNHLLTLINDILDISKVESGKLNLSPITFSIVETVENLVNLSQPMIKEKNIIFSFRTNRFEKEFLYADQLRLNQIYINILSNAIKYTMPGGSVSVDLREESSEKEGCVKLIYRVEDTGIGMSPEFLEKMYQPFSRQTDSRVNSIQGTGLGLAITRQIVELMNGSIECQSELEKGTAFTITLDIPVAEKQLEEMSIDGVDALIADDDPILLETAVDTLESMGIHAERANTGLEALEMIRRRHEAGKDYNVVILDWKMPEPDGIETIKRFRKEIGAAIPILLTSAYDWSDIEEEAKAAGANGFISKPLFRSGLYGKINELLGTEVKTVEPTEDYSDLAGLNILIAEDNDINWEIISTMLSMFGITSERAENGRICVEKMAEATEGRYDLIFMDVQMPEMNGLDATRHIRKLENRWAASIPIIAMTADAFSENVAECLQAGMNGHIAKPIDLKLVVKEIRRIKEERK
ncbi:MAG: response regulator [Lachnospiraceae bacterium]|nr:response regulator [Lachnospiraceae bacterium]